jgi:hypothetical protein
MPFLENFESHLDKYIRAENDGLALKIFSDFCCDGCSCKSEQDHKN